MTRPIIALGVSHLDVALAELWLKWVSHLSMQEGADNREFTLVVMGTKRITPEQWKLLRDAVLSIETMFKIDGAILPDENEAGYPISASHLFLRTLEYCESEYPDHPVLWVEADAIPVKSSWAHDIAAEYAACSKPFLGALENSKPPHMPGVAVYPPNWRELSPKLAGVLQAPDLDNWGKGKGQAFDTYAGDQIVPQAAVSRTIQQIWRAQPFNKQRLTLIRPDTSLFHQSKDGMLIKTLAEERYPGFDEKLEKPPETWFATRGHHINKVIIRHEVFPVKLRTMRLAGGWWSVIEARTEIELKKLQALAREGLVEPVTRQALEHEAAKVLNNRRVRNV